MQIKEAASAGYKIFEKLAVVAILGVCGWVVTGLEAVKEEVSEIKTNKRENAAQWQLLNDHASRMRAFEVDLQVNARIFRMLLGQNKIDLNPGSAAADDEDDKQAAEDRFKQEMDKKLKEYKRIKGRDPNEFRREQMQLPNRMAPKGAM